MMGDYRCITCASVVMCDVYIRVHVLLCAMCIYVCMCCYVRCVYMCACVVMCDVLLCLCFGNRKPLPIEVQMTSLRFSPERKLYTGTAKRRSLSTYEDRQSGGAVPSHSARHGANGSRVSKGASSMSSSVGLPPLITPKPQVRVHAQAYGPCKI